MPDSVASSLDEHPKSEQEWLEAVLEDTSELEEVPQDILNKKDFAKKALAIVDDEMLFSIANAQSYFPPLYYFPQHNNDKAFVMEAITYVPLSFEYADDSLKNDNDVIRLAIAEEPYNLEFIDTNHPNYLEFLKTALKNSEDDGLLRNAPHKHRCRYDFKDAYIATPQRDINLVELLEVNGIEVTSNAQAALEKLSSTMLHELGNFPINGKIMDVKIKSFMYECIDKGEFNENSVQWINHIQYIADQLTLFAERCKPTEIVLDAVGKEEDRFRSFLLKCKKYSKQRVPIRRARKTRDDSVTVGDCEYSHLILSHGDVQLRFTVKSLLQDLQIGSDDLDKLMVLLEPLSPIKHYPRKEYILDLSYPGIHPREYLWNARKQPLGYKNERGEIILAPDAGGWESIFNSLKLSNMSGRYQFSKDFTRSLHGVLHHFIHPLAPGRGDFSQVLSSVKEDKPNQLKLEKALSEWLNTYSQANNPQINALNRYLDRDDPDAINDPIVQHMRQNHLSCSKRCQIFMAFMNFAGLGEKYCVVTNGCHAWIANSSGQAIDLGGVQADCRIKKQAVGDPAVHAQTPRLRAFNPAESGEKVCAPVVNQHFSDGPTLEVQQMMDKFGCISGSLDEIQNTKSLPDDPTSSCITADNLDIAYQELKKKYPDYPILIIHPGNYNHKELVAYKEKKDESGEKFIILFNIEYTPGKNGDDIYRSFQDQTTCKQACDSEEPKFNDVGTQNIPCMYFTGRNNTHVLPSLISRVPKNFNVSSSGPVFGPQPMTVSPEDPCISLAGFSIDDALCDIEITPHPGKSGFYSVNHKLPEEIGKLLTPEEVESASPMVVILNVKEATLADRLKIEEFNHELLHGRPIFLNGSWRYGSLTFQLRINPELQHAPSSYILKPTPFNMKAPSESSISMTIDRQTDHAQSDDAHEDAEVDEPSCQENVEIIMVSVGSKLWDIKETPEGDYSEFSGRKTNLCMQMEATLKANKSIHLHGQISNECLDQLWEYFPADVARIKVNGNSLITGCPPFEAARKGLNPPPIDYAGYSSSLSSSQTVTHVQGPCALYQCLQDHYQDKLIDDNPIAWSLKEWLGATTVIQHVIIDGSSLTLEDRSILETLQKNDHQISCIHYQGNIYPNRQLDSVKFHIINPLVLLDGVQEQKVTVDSQYKQTICRIAMQKKDGKEEEQSQDIMIPDEVLACVSADNLALAARLSNVITPKGLEMLLSENREKPRPFSSQDCPGLAPQRLANYVNIRPEIASIIQLLRECAKDGLGFGVLLTGPPGIGKSLIANKMAASWGAENSKEAGPNSYHIFDGHPREGDIERLTDFWNKGGSVCINEFENPIWQAELDKLKSTTPPHKDFFVIASSNFPPSSKTSFPILAQASWRIEEQHKYIMEKLAAHFQTEFQVDELRKRVEAYCYEELSKSKNPLGARELDHWCGFIEEKVRSQLKLIAPKRKGPALFNNGGFHNGGKKTRLQEGHAEPGSSSAADSSMSLSR